MTKWRRILYQPNLPLGENGKRVTACPENIRLSKNAAKETGHKKNDIYSELIN